MYNLLKHIAYEKLDSFIIYPIGFSADRCQPSLGL